MTTVSSTAVAPCTKSRPTLKNAGATGYKSASPTPSRTPPTNRVVWASSITEAIPAIFEVAMVCRTLTANTSHRTAQHLSPSLAKADRHLSGEAHAADRENLPQIQLRGLQPHKYFELRHSYRQRLAKLVLQRFPNGRYVGAGYELRQS